MSQPHPSRREILGLLGGLGATAVFAACGGVSGTATRRRSTTGAGNAAGSAGTATTTSPAGLASCTVIPEETAGPFPADGTNGPNVLTQRGVVRRDITSSFGSASASATGVPLTIELTVVDSANGCRPLADAAVYVWHCDIDGNYSMYSQGVSDENYLRGVQATDANGVVSFDSVFPAAYSGRWPHVHFEVFRSVSEATNGSNAIRTSQLALPEDVCDAVYATSGYGQSVTNLARTSLQTDMVFSDGWSLQVPSVDGSTSNRLTATLALAV
jgi:protocatechuate 3,4-dioxygenase beta subunit